MAAVIRRSQLMFITAWLFGVLSITLSVRGKLFWFTYVSVNGRYPMVICCTCIICIIWSRCNMQRLYIAQLEVCCSEKVAEGYIECTECLELLKLACQKCGYCMSAHIDCYNFLSRQHRIYQIWWMISAFVFLFVMQMDCGSISC